MFRRVQPGRLGLNRPDHLDPFGGPDVAGNRFLVDGAGSGGGGLWISNDEGETWRMLSQDPRLLSISGIVIDPRDSDTIYVLTGDGNGSVAPVAPARPSVGVLKHAGPVGPPIRFLRPAPEPERGLEPGPAFQLPLQQLGSAQHLSILGQDDGSVGQLTVFANASLGFPRAAADESRRRVDEAVHAQMDRLIEAYG